MNFVLFCFYCFLVSGASNTSRKTNRKKANSPSKSSDTASAAVDTLSSYEKFQALVQKAIDRELHTDFSSPNLKCERLTETEKKIYETYIAYPGRFQWSYTLQMCCQQNALFGSVKLSVQELLPIGLSRILKAEGVNINKLLENDRVKADWSRLPDNVALVYSGILKKKVILEKANFLPSLMWLFFSYYDSFPNSRTIMSEVCPEEVLIRQRKVQKKARVPSNTLKRKTLKKVDGDEEDINEAKSSYELVDHPVSAASVPENMVDQKALTRLSRKNKSKVIKGINVDQKFKDLVQEAINKKLPERFLTAPEFTKDEKMEKLIFNINENCSQANYPWSDTFREVCLELQIFSTKPINVGRLILIGLSRILKAEGVDISDLFKAQPANVDWTREVKNVETVYSAIMGTKVNIEKDNMLPSLTWLFVRYHQEYSEKRDILLTVCSEENRLPHKKRSKRKRQEKDNSETEWEEDIGKAEVGDKEPAAKRKKTNRTSGTNHQIVHEPFPQFVHGYTNNSSFISYQAQNEEQIQHNSDDKEVEGAQHSEYNMDEVPTDAMNYDSYFQLPSIVIPKATYPPNYDYDNNYGPQFNGVPSYSASSITNIINPSSTLTFATAPQYPLVHMPIPVVPSQYALRSNSQQPNFAMPPYSDLYYSASSNAYASSNYDQPQQHQ